VNGWLWAATAFAAALVPLLGVAALCTPLHGLVAAEAAGVDAALAMLLFAEGTKSQSFASLALVLGVLSFVGAIGFIRFLTLIDPAGDGDR
jgi:multisubunit Na+/H+ antiporter MnhF subunit